ncbi:MAG: hypothetical protein JNM90_00775 [Burkholderiales bacterium]|nr:hypothetical protein [Burkholderiales bacterium]
MAERYTARIRAYCEAHGIEIPVGFARHPASRYAAIQVDPAPPRLVARTWFNQEDLLHFLASADPARRFRLLDFKEHLVLHADGDGRLLRGEPF